MPDNKHQYGWTKYNADQPKDKGILLPQSLYLKFAAEAKLTDAVSQLRFINADNLILWAYSKANRVISQNTANAFLQSQVQEGLLLELNDKENGQHFVRTKKWKNENPIANVKLSSASEIDRLTEQGFKK
jgi:hypothetical protein